MSNLKAFNNASLNTEEQENIQGQLLGLFSADKFGTSYATCNTCFDTNVGFNSNLGTKSTYTTNSYGTCGTSFNFGGISCFSGFFSLGGGGSEIR